MYSLPHKNNKAESNKSSNGRGGQHQVKDVIDKLKGWPTKTSRKQAIKERRHTKGT